MKKPSLELIDQYRSSQDLSIHASYLIVILMMICAAAGIVQMGQALSSTWSGMYLIWLVLLVSVEGLLTRHRTADMELRDKIIFRLSEWVALAVLVKIALYIVRGPAQILEDIPLWQEDFTRHFFTPEYVLSLFTCFLAWLATRSYAFDLEELSNHELDTEWDDLGKRQNKLHEIRKRIASRVFLIGGVVVTLAVFSRIDETVLMRLTGVPPHGYTAPVVNVLAYFLLALALLSQTQFALLRTRWFWQRMSIGPQIARNWIRYGLIAFVILSVIVYFLPTEYSLGLFDTLRLSLDFLIKVVNILFLLITLPVTLCLSLFNISSRQQQQDPVQPPPMIVPQQPSGQPVEWLEFVRSLIFWVIFLGIILFALRYYLSQNAALWNAIRGFPLIRWAGGIWQSLRSWLKGANQQVAAIVKRGVSRLMARRPSIPAAQIRRMFNLSRMSPREKIIYFYLNLVHLGGERGIARRPSQTPSQYEQQVISAVPEVDADLHALTGVFLEARYSSHAVEEPAAQQAGSLWERIKAILTAQRR